MKHLEFTNTCWKFYQQLRLWFPEKRITLKKVRAELSPLDWSPDSWVEISTHRPGDLKDSPVLILQDEQRAGGNRLTGVQISISRLLHLGLFLYIVSTQAR